MVPILAGLGAALAFATATLCNSRSSRMIGPAALVAWVMALGLALLVPALVIDGAPADLDTADGAWMAVAGLGNVAGLLLAYAALRIGKVGLVAPILSTEGALAAVIAVLAGEEIAPGSGAMLAVIACGVLLAAIARDADEVDVHAPYSHLSAAASHAGARPREARGSGAVRQRTARPAARVRGLAA